MSWIVKQTVTLVSGGVKGLQIIHGLTINNDNECTFLLFTVRAPHFLEKVIDCNNGEMTSGMKTGKLETLISFRFINLLQMKLLNVICCR